MDTFRTFCVCLQVESPGAKNLDYVTRASRSGGVHQPPILVQDGALSGSLLVHREDTGLAGADNDGLGDRKAGAQFQHSLRPRAGVQLKGQLRIDLPLAGEEQGHVVPAD